MKVSFPLALSLPRGTSELKLTRPTDMLTPLDQRLDALTDLTPAEM